MTEDPVIQAILEFGASFAGVFLGFYLSMWDDRKIRQKQKLRPKIGF